MSEIELKNKLRTLAVQAKSVADDTTLSASEKMEKLDAMRVDQKAYSDELSVIEKSKSFAYGADSAPQADVEAKGVAAGPRTVSEAVLSSAQYKSAVTALSAREHFTRTVDVKGTLGEAVSSTVTTAAPLTAGQYFQNGSAGVDILPNFLPGIVPLRFQPLVIADLFAQGSTDSPVISYVKESTFTNATAGVAEGGTHPYSDDNLSRVVEQVGKLGHSLKVTDEMLQDAPAYESFLNGRLLLGLQLKEQNDLLYGTGYPSIPGLLGRTGLQTAVALTTNITALSIMEAIFQQMTNIRFNAFVEPDAIVINPLDFQTIRLGKDANNQYFSGGPFTGAYGTPGSGGVPDQLWGLRVIVTPAIAVNTILVGGFRECAQIFRRQGMTVEMTNSNVNDFDLGLITIRAEERLALAVYRPGGFGTVTHT